MKKIFILSFFFLSCFCQAQKQDRIWVFGDSIEINFNNLASPSVTQVPEFYMDELYVTISDSIGNLLFYSNGDSTNYNNFISIFSNNYQLMDSGDSIISNHSITNGGMIIPNPNVIGEYFLFHIGGSPNKLYYSVIDMNLNGGLGKVIQKNILLSNDLMSEKLTAVKHANGRDWWLIAHSVNSPNFTEYLIDLNGIHIPNYLTVGNYISSSAFAGEICFSKLGNRLVAVTNTGRIDLFSFDRCTGELSNWINLSDTTNGFYGCSFSENENVLYVSGTQKLFKFDLTQSDILQSKTLLWSVGGSKQIGQHELAPNGKVYIATTNGALPNASNTHLSVINDPDNFLTPNFVQFSFSLNGRMCNYGLPNMPNYNLGKIVDSPCDTIPNAISEIQNNYEDGIRIFPNPVSNELTVEVLNGITPKEIEIVDVLGRVVMKITPHKPDIQMKMYSVACGVYFVKVKMQDGNFISKKIIKL